VAKAATLFEMDILGDRFLIYKKRPIQLIRRNRRRRACSAFPLLGDSGLLGRGVSFFEKRLIRVTLFTTAHLPCKAGMRPTDDQKRQNQGLKDRFSCPFHDFS
jgi:hypothetical protein